jgi:CheY-like chemotaxis protein
MHPADEIPACIRVPRTSIPGTSYPDGPICQGSPGENGSASSVAIARSKLDPAGVDRTIGNNSRGRFKASILVIDDDPIHRAALVRHLALHRYSITACSEPKETLVVLSRSDANFHVVVWNVTRVQWDCLDVLRTINELYRQSPRPRPRILCISVVYRGPQFRLDIERLGARLIYE